MALTDNLVSYYKLDESSGNAADSVGSNTLTNNNSTAFATGKINNGADLELTSSNSLSKTSPVDVAFTSSFTINCWVKPESLSSDGTRLVIASKYYDGSVRGWYFGLAESSGADNTKLHARLGNTAGSAAVDYYSNTGAVAAGTWAMVTMVFDDTSDLVRFYVNGTAWGTTAKTDQIAASSANLYIGAEGNNGSPNQFFDGLLDEVGIWSRALSAAEVISLYNASIGKQYPFTANGKVLVVAGGGSGAGGEGNGNGVGGGGAGGLLYTDTYSLAAGSYTVTVGDGGTAGSGGVSGTSTSGNNGGNSVFNDITATGGGGGGKSYTGTPEVGKNGGSGGGGGGEGTNTKAGGTGIVGQGYAGGTGQGDSPYRGGGGGGSAAVGVSGATSGNGGAGIADASIGGLLAMTSSGVSGYIAGGGGGGSFNTGTPGTGGSGGGGNGENGSDAGIAGTANTGSGGGGAGSPTAGTGPNGGAGGKGLVLVTYPTASFTHTGGNSTGTSGSETWVKFTADGTLVLSAASSANTTNFFF